MYSDSRDFQSYQQHAVGIQHGTPVVARGKGAGQAGEAGKDARVSISQVVNGWMEGESHDRPASRDIQVG